MEIMITEAAEVLAVSKVSVFRWYTGASSNASNPSSILVIDSEVLCEIIGLDHRFMMAFLTGYDIALSRNQVAYIFRRPLCWAKRHVLKNPVFKRPGSGSFGKVSTVRYSYRRVAPLLLAELEKQHGNHRASAFGGGVLLPAPDTLPSDTWTFCSKVTTEGTRLPRARSTSLADGRASTLVLPDRDADWKRRRTYTRIRADGDE